MKIFAISGSLRRASSNTALIHALATLAAGEVDVDFYGELAELPAFDPDIEDRDAPDVVHAFRRRIEQADVVLISSPEYAHGVPGVLKNALDWIVGSGELVGKPIALVNTSARATRAYASLADTLTVMSGHLIPGASTIVPVATGATVNDLVADPRVSADLRVVIRALLDVGVERDRTGAADDERRKTREV